jgi:hypothetical protein
MTMIFLGIVAADVRIRPVGMVQGGHGHAAEHDLLYGGSASDPTTSSAAS